MKICFISNENACFRAKSEKLFSGYSHQCVFMSSLADFKKELDMPFAPFDLIICDSLLAEMNGISIFKMIKRCKMVMPVIFYNEETEIAEDRVTRWINTNEHEYKPVKMDYLLGKFTEIDKILEFLFSNEPYADTEKTQQDRENYFLFKRTLADRKKLIKFREKSTMPPVIFSLFKVLYKKRNRAVSIKRLSLMTKPYFFANRRSPGWIYVYISRLKKFMEETECENFKDITIIKPAAGYYEMIETT